MPTQNYDGSWTGDDGQPFDMQSANNDAAYNGRVWGTRTSDGPAPKPGSYDTGGFSPEVVAKLLQQPGVRAGIAYFAAKGERPNLNKIAALDQQVIPGYKNLGSSQVEDHSLRNGLLTGAAIVGGGAALQGLTTGFGAGASAASSTLPSTAINAGLFTAPTSVASGAVPAALAGGTEAGAGAAGATMSSLTDGSFPEEFGQNAVDSEYGTVAGDGLQSGGSLTEKLLASLKDPSKLANIGSLLGSMSSGAKANRVTAAQMLDAYNKDMISAQTARDQDEASSLQKLAQTGYLLNGHGGYTPGTVTEGGKQVTLPDYGFGYTAPSQAQKDGATALQSQLVDRLKPGGTYTPIKPQTDPGTLENIGSYGGTAAGLAGGLLNMFSPASDGPDYSKIGKTIMSYFGSK